MTRQKGFMTKDMFVRIIDEIKGKTEFIYLYGMGESLLHPHFFEMAGYAVKNGIKTSFSTNITLLSEDNSRRLLESGIDFVVLALDGTNKETYEKIRVNSHFEKNIEQTKRFLTLKKRLGSRTYVDLQFILMDINRKDVPKIKSLFTEEERSAINAYRIKPVYISPSVNNEQVSHRHPCYLLWNTMTIAWDGRVPLCCMDFDAQMVVGDSNKQGIYDIWNDKALARIRAMHKELKYDNLQICSKCNLPEMGYFSAPTILANIVFGAATLRKLMPFFEKVFINREKRLQL